MANSTFQQFVLSKIKRLVRLYPVFTMSGTTPVLQKRQFTAAGASSVAASSSLVNAPTSGTPAWAQGDGAGTFSVSRTGTGAWTITLSEPYQYLLGVTISQTSNTTGALTVVGVGVVSGSTTITTNTAPGNGGVIAVVFSSAAATAADPGSSDTITLEITLGDATEP